MNNVQRPGHNTMLKAKPVMGAVARQGGMVKPSGNQVVPTKRWGQTGNARGGGREMWGG